MKTNRNLVSLMGTDFDIKFPSIEGHTCLSARDGDWTIFTCPFCEGYERRINWRTQEMKVINDRPDIQHSGSYFPTEYSEAFTELN